MAGATISNMDALLQNDYQAKVLDALNNSSWLYTKLKRKVLNWTGRQAVYAVKVSRGNSADYTTGTPPTEDHAVYVNLNVQAKQLQGRGRLTSELMIATDAASAKAFVSAVTSENKNCEEALIQKANRNFWSGGLSVGFLNQHKVEAGAGDWEFAGDVTKLVSILAQGAVTVDVIRLDTYAVLAAGVSLNSIDAVNCTLNLGALNTTAVAQGFACGVKIKTMVDAAITLAGIGAQPVGIYGQMIEPTHFGADRTTATGSVALQSNCFTANKAGAQGRTALTSKMVGAMAYRIEDNSGTRPNQIVGHSSALEQYAAIFQAAMRVTQSADTKSGAPAYNGGYMSLSWGDMPFDSDKDCCKGAIFFLNWEYFILAERQPVKLWTHAGSAFRPIANSTDVEFIYEGFHNSFIELPRTAAVLCGLSFDV